MGALSLIVALVLASAQPAPPPAEPPIASAQVERWRPLITEASQRFGVGSAPRFPETSVGRSCGANRSSGLIPPIPALPLPP